MYIVCIAAVWGEPNFPCFIFGGDSLCWPRSRPVPLILSKTLILIRDSYFERRLSLSCEAVIFLELVLTCQYRLGTALAGTESW